MNGEYQYYDRIHYVIMIACIFLVLGMSTLMLIIKQHLAAIISLITVYVDKLANGDLSSLFTIKSRISEIVLLNSSLEKLHDYFNLLIRNINRETTALKKYGGNIELVAQNLNINRLISSRMNCVKITGWREQKNEAKSAKKSSKP